MQLLVVEDGPGDAALVAALLQDAAPGEFAVEAPPLASQPVDRLLEDGIDCVVLDLGAAGADGLEALDRLLAAALHVPVVALGDRDDEVSLAAVRAGAQDYLVKGSTDGAALARSLRHAVERGRIQRDLARQALQDPLTGLPNRTLFFDRLRQALSRLGRTQTCLAVLFVDLDRFKAVNDEHGHAAGDAALRAVADRMAGVLRGGDTAARIGGDEFVVLCEDVAGQEEAVGIAARLLAELGVPASMGIALASRGDEDPDALVRDADAAMYAVKRRGGAAVGLVGQDAAARNASTTAGPNREPAPEEIVSSAAAPGHAAS